ncbi:MAG: RNA pseudouridine synthase [Treponema sp.]|nr:RNA pseudouridine synthase [Treponema sp.]
MTVGVGARILLLDAHCVVVNKLPGEAVEGARAGIASLPEMLAEEIALRAGVPSAHDALAKPEAAHRLDVPVSGCALFARSSGALRLFNQAFSQGEIEKRYWAIVEAAGLEAQARGFVEKLQGAARQPVEIAHWLRFDSRSNKSFAQDEPGAALKKAVMRCAFVGTGRDYLFLEIELVTGRHHQIRAQLARLGLKIKGDLKYGARRSEKNGGIRLHARGLSFADPSGTLKRGAQERVTVKAEAPADALWLAFEDCASRRAYS